MIHEAQAAGADRASRTCRRRALLQVRSGRGRRRTCRSRSCTCRSTSSSARAHPNSISILPGVVRPLSRGWVRLAERRPAREAARQPELPRRAEPTWRPTRQGGQARARDLRDQGVRGRGSARSCMPGRRRPKTDDDLDAFVRATADSYHHQAGSCKMGLDELAVVDPELRVHGVEGLRVADASVMPVVPSGNCHAGIVMIAERCADWRQDDARPAPRGRRRPGRRVMSLDGQEDRRPHGERLLRGRDLLLQAPLPRGGRRASLPDAALGPGAAHVRTATSTRCRSRSTRSSRT